MMGDAFSGNNDKMYCHYSGTVNEVRNYVLGSVCYRVKPTEELTEPVYLQAHNPVLLNLNEGGVGYVVCNTRNLWDKKVQPGR